MKIAMLADLHGNLEALQACLRHASREGVDTYAFIGDLVGYGADPGPIIDIVADHVARHAAIVVRGNHDDAIANPSDRMNDAARAAIDWTRARLSAGHQRFLADLPLMVERDGVCYVHASADDPGAWNYVIDDRHAARSLAAVDATWTFCGHVHDQTLYYQGSGRRLMAFRPVPATPIPVGRHRRWLAIVGSSGQPRDGNPAAAYAVFDSTAAQLCFHRVPYDFQSAAARIRAAGLPESLAARLEHP